ncbi:hypothetical protein HN51_005579 [Arachis hypogaea]
MLKIKEDFDYKILSQKLEVQLDKLIAENERQGKAFDDEVEKEAEMSDGVHGIGSDNSQAAMLLEAAMNSAMQNNIDDKSNVVDLRRRNRKIPTNMRLRR